MSWTSFTIYSLKVGLLLRDLRDAYSSRTRLALFFSNDKGESPRRWKRPRWGPSLDIAHWRVFLCFIEGSGTLSLLIQRHRNEP